MKRAKMLISGIVVAAALAVSAVSYTQEEAPNMERMERTPDAISRNVVPRYLSKICAVHLEVDKPGAHLRDKHVLALFGPLPMDKSYLVFPLHPGVPVVDPLAWDTGVKVAQQTGLGGGNIYIINSVKVREDPGEHPAWTSHPIILEITKMEDGCPKEAELHGYPHDGIHGFHGGRAHVTR